MELEELSVVEKAAMLSGGSEWDSRGNEKAGIPSFVMSDGPHGVRRQLGEGDHLGLGAPKPATCFPTAGTRVAVIGDMARTPRFQGSGSSKVNATREENIFDELNAAAQTTGVTVAGYAQGYDRQGAKNQTLIDEAKALDAAESTDAVIVVVGLDERSESEGLDRSTMAIPQAQNELVDALTATGKPVIIVLVAGSPVELPWFDAVSAILYVGLSGQAGASATVRALTGQINPSGHLAETWPMSYADCPSAGWYPAIGRDAIYREGLFVGYRCYETANVPVRFPFGYGLGYAAFAYSDLTADETGVQFTVTNDSDVAGATVAQLYVTGPSEGVLRPARELKVSPRSSSTHTNPRPCASNSTATRSATSTPPPTIGALNPAHGRWRSAPSPPWSTPCSP